MKQTKKWLIIIGVAVLIILTPVVYTFYRSQRPATPFSMEVVPTHMQDTITGQRCVFLVVVADDGQGRSEGKAVDISATAPSSAVTVNPQAITPRQVAEVTVIPNEASIGGNLTVTVHGERDGLTQTATVTVTVQKATGTESELDTLATEIRDKFIPWLAANHPEFGITSETEWIGTLIRPHILVVMYYLFFSEEWEMGMTWHVTIPPHNWARIYLSRRFTEVSPSYAFELSSWTAEDYEIYPVDLKDAFAEEVWR